ncbi:MAG: hypothetical protein NVSMB45_05410 [Ginsengibacter sp.]
MRGFLAILGLILIFSGCESKNDKYPIIDPLQSTAFQKKPDSVNNFSTDSSKSHLTTSSVAAPTTTKSLLDNVSASMDHTLFIAALQSSGVDNLLSGKKNYTVFAPTDEAFKKLPHGGVNSMLKASNKEVLHQMIINHIAESKFTSATLKDGMTLKMLGGKAFKIENKDGRIMINGVSIRSGETVCTNGTLFITDGLITN